MPKSKILIRNLIHIVEIMIILWLDETTTCICLLILYNTEPKLNPSSHQNSQPTDRIKNKHHRIITYLYQMLLCSLHMILIIQNGKHHLRTTVLLRFLPPFFFDFFSSPFAWCSRSRSPPPGWSSWPWRPPAKIKKNKLTKDNNNWPWFRLQSYFWQIPSLSITWNYYSTICVASYQTRIVGFFMIRIQSVRPQLHSIGTEIKPQPQDNPIKINKWIYNWYIALWYWSAKRKKIDRECFSLVPICGRISRISVVRMLGMWGPRITSRDKEIWCYIVKPKENKQRSKAWPPFSLTWTLIPKHYYLSNSTPINFCSLCCFPRCILNLPQNKRILCSLLQCEESTKSRPFNEQKLEFHR